MTAPVRPAVDDRTSAGPAAARGRPRAADRVRARMATAGVDALLVTDLTNVRYLTGFTGSAGRAAARCPTSWCSSPTAATATRRPSELAAAGADGPRRDRAVARRPDASALAERRPRPSAALGPRGRPRHAGPRTAATGTRCRHAELVATDGAGRGRAARRKDAGEVARIERAAAIADAGARRRRRACSTSEPDRARVRPRPRHRHARASAPRARASRPSWRRARTRPSPTTGPSDRRIRRRRPAWSSTSAPSSTATAPT